MVKTGRVILAMLFVGVLMAGCDGSSKRADVTHTAAAKAGHVPGSQDVSTTDKGKEFNATPNFYFFESCGRPCWLPLYPSPELVAGTAVTDGWPCEYFDEASKVRGPYCADHTSSQGDKVRVICQVRGNSTLGQGTLQNDNQVRSNVWDKIVVPVAKVTNGTSFYAYGADIWLGNTGWHDVPC